MMADNRNFPLFQSHLDLADGYWKKLLLPGDRVIDATCGNGHDTLKLCKLAFNGEIWALDNQAEAIAATGQKLSQEIPKGIRPQTILRQCCHSQFPKEIPPQSVKLIVYNLGYLPRGDKAATTMTTTTLASLKAAKELLMPGGAISVTCYPGHQEGEREQLMLQKYCQGLPPSLWSCTCHVWLNRSKSPSLLLLQKANPLEK